MGAEKFETAVRTRRRSSVRRENVKIMIIYFSGRYTAAIISITRRRALLLRVRRTNLVDEGVLL